MNLLLYDRPARSDAFWGNITPDVSEWRCDSRAIGGYWTGSFSVRDVTREELATRYSRWVGCRLVETTFGLVGWEGMIYQLDGIFGGVNYRRTLDAEWFHNEVKTLYRYPDASDDKQGNVSYTTEGGHATFTDDGQDFSDWETTSGDAQYQIDVTNDDFSVAWAFLGAAVAGNTEIYVYRDIELTERGWNGETGGKTPLTYEVSDVELAGKQQDTGWEEVADSVSRFGERQYVVALGSATPGQAANLRDVHLREFAWPRSRIVGRVSLGEQRDAENVLEVRAMGFWHTLNWLHREGSTAGAASRLVEDFLGAAEFVSAGRIEDNPTSCRVDCDYAPQGYGDLIEHIIERGDVDGNKWRGGVYAGRRFVYEQAPTSVRYYLCGGRLLDYAGAPVSPSLVKPGFLLRSIDAPMEAQSPGGNAWNDPGVVYVESVEFTAPDQLSLQLYGEEESIELLRQELEATRDLPASQR